MDDDDDLRRIEAFIASAADKHATVTAMIVYSIHYLAGEVGVEHAERLVQRRLDVLRTRQERPRPALRVVP